MSTIILICVLGYGLSQIGKAIKNNPGRSLQAATLLKQWLMK